MAKDKEKKPKEDKKSRDKKADKSKSKQDIAKEAAAPPPAAEIGRQNCERFEDFCLVMNDSLFLSHPPLVFQPQCERKCQWPI